MTERERRIIIAGAGRFGRELAAWLEAYGGYDLLGFIDDASREADVISTAAEHRPIIGCEYVVAIGAASARLRVGRMLEALGCRLATIISPYAMLAQACGAARGALVLGNCSISSGVVFGRQVLVREFASVARDARLGDGAGIGAHAVVGPGAVIGSGAVLHAHCTVLPGVQIGDYADVGSGAVVTTDVEAGAMVAGNPARMLARRQSPADPGAATLTFPARFDLH